MTDPTQPDYSGYPQQTPQYQQPYPQQPIYGAPQLPMYGQPFAPMVPPKKSHTTAWVLGIIGGVVVVVLICVVGGIFVLGAGAKSVSNSVNTQKRSADADVSITNCTTQEVFGTTTAGDAIVSITNSTSATADYFVTVAFESPDGATQYDTAVTTVNDLAPGQTTTANASGFETVPTTAVCKIVSVNRI